MKVQKRNEEILSRIRNLKAEHPFWGYRRVWAYLKYRQNILINRKRVYLLMKKHKIKSYGDIIKRDYPKKTKAYKLLN